MPPGTWFGLQLAAADQLPPAVLVQAMSAPGAAPEIKSQPIRANQVWRLRRKGEESPG